MNKLVGVFKTLDNSTYVEDIITTDDEIRVVDMGEYFSAEVSPPNLDIVVSRAFILKHSLLYLLLEKDGN